MEFGDKILILAKIKGMNTSEFAAYLKVPQPTLHNYTMNKIEPKLSFYSKLLKAFPNLNEKWFFNGEGNILNDTTDKTKASEEIELKHLKRENELLIRIDEQTRKIERIEKELSSIKSPGESVSLKHELKS